MLDEWINKFSISKKNLMYLYLGVSTGTTISHISDIIGPKGIVFGVEHSSRVATRFFR